ncbi:hypothetical protein EF847_15935 [Actinobacteria bacterium YIM 96077]|uniref:Uncharacterized protein n=1 Tax=Phytoactinopolyspora halophila TaxID=1981511 RepID=A0A329QAP0_9ACTN|nr:PQQ-binding-like beta-propeller repeat protein [Phytoactinopolyspora halophila]AYY13967.1 hypothetical protein EF847_15935 [Actinobacteria bacterium YIM 96077]RAW09406.1 hypothetical protein DPM12_21390 [Phytoactinopolyspora halophila]
MWIETKGLSRRSLLAAAASSLLVPAAASTGVAASPARSGTAGSAGPLLTRSEGGEPVSLGSPLTDVNMVGAQVFTRNDGVPMLCGVTSGSPASVSGVDARTGELLFSEPLPGASGSYGAIVGPDGLVYLGSQSNGLLFRVDPSDGTVEELGRPLAGETYVWELVVGDDGQLFGVTYPGARLFRYNPETGDVHDYGSVVSDTKYARAVEATGGSVYVGTSRGVHLLRVDPGTGDIRELGLPDGVEAGDVGTSVWEVNASGGLLYVRLGDDIKYSPLYAFDPSTEEWIASLDNVAGLHMAEPGPDGRVYVMHDNELTGWDPHTGETTSTGLLYPGRVWNYRGVGWVELDDPDWPGQTLTGWFWRGEMWRYNPQTGQHSMTDGATVPGEPRDVLSLVTTHDGAVLAGGFLAGFARVDPDDATTDFNRFSQTESLLDDGESVWVGAYPDARGYQYDPDEPWNSSEYSPGPPGTPENPVKIWDLKGHDDPQDRVFAIARAGQYIVAGTGPAGPTFGGALVVHDTEADDYRVTAAELGDRAVCDLAVDGGVVYAGTWIHGGSGAPEPPETEGNLFAYDPGSDQILWSATPVPGAASYAGVHIDRDGLLWTIADTTLAEIDPETGEAIRTVELGDRPAGGRTFPNTVAILREAPDAPALYVKSAGRLWRVWTRTGAVEDLGLSGYRLFTVLPDGSLVLADAEELFRWDPPAYDESGPTISVTSKRHGGEWIERIVIEAEDTGGSGLWEVRYRLRGGDWTEYTGPIAVSRPGRHHIEVTAVDGAGNETTDTQRVLVRPNR